MGSGPSRAETTRSARADEIDNETKTIVTPANAGAHWTSGARQEKQENAGAASSHDGAHRPLWIPAFAGMTRYLVPGQQWANAGIHCGDSA